MRSLILTGILFGVFGLAQATEPQQQTTSPALEQAFVAGDNIQPGNVLTQEEMQNSKAASPACFEIDLGDGTKFWYPDDCPK